MTEEKHITIERKPGMSTVRIILIMLRIVLQELIQIYLQGNLKITLKKL